MRKLTLHASALSDAEYQLYTTSLDDIALTEDEVKNSTTAEHHDDYYENMTVGIREVRAWLRGRYSGLAAVQLDTILRFFSPTLSHGDTISGGEFFAVLRLVLHAEDGKEVDRALAFVQAHPNEPSLPQSVAVPFEHQPKSPATDLPAARLPAASSLNPFESKQSQDGPPLRYTAHNPFVQKPKYPALSSRSVDGRATLPPLPPRKTLHPTILEHAPTLAPPPRHASVMLPRQGRSVSPSVPVAHFAIPSGHTSVPPRPLNYSGLPPVPAKPPSHVTSTLIKQSLQASKAAQTMKKAEEQLEKERVMQVLKSSSVASGSHSLAGTNVRNSSMLIEANIHRSSSPVKMASSGATSQTSKSDESHVPPILPQRKTAAHPSPPLSTTSLEQVALAAPPFTMSRFSPKKLSDVHDVPTRHRAPAALVDAPTTMLESPLSSPSRSVPHLSSHPPPRHPDRKVPSTPTHFSIAPVVGSRHSDPAQSSSVESFEAVYGPTSSPASSSIFNVTRGQVSPTAHVFRSKSMHHAHSSFPPVSRKRPESVQMLGKSVGEHRYQNSIKDFEGDATDFSALSRRASLSKATPSAQRRSSLSSVSGGRAKSSESHRESSMNSFQRTIATLQPKLDALQIQPRFEKVRYKAEAGLSRRGFLRDTSGRSRLEGDEEGLVRDGVAGRGSANARNENAFGQDDAEVDGDWSDGLQSGSARENFLRGRVLEQDNLKLPAGEGWKAL